MIVAVVAIHSNISIHNPELENRTLFYYLLKLTSNLIWVSVPIFFFISGLLFFKEGTFSKSLYIHKLKSRLYTLLIPYILWNILYFLIVLLLQLANPNFQLLLHKSISDFNWQDYLWVFWDISQITHLPDDQETCLVGVFWFLQCLFTLCIISPLIYLLLKYTRHFFILLPLLLLFSDYEFSMTGINNVSIIYFCLGAYISLMKIDFFNYLKCIPLGLSVVLILTFVVLISYTDNNQLLSLNQLILQTAVLSLFVSLVDKYGICFSSSILSSTFYIFAVHRLFTALLMHVSIIVIRYINNDLLLYIYYLLLIAIAVFLSYATYCIMTIFFPKISNILNGQRTQIISQ